MEKSRLEFPSIEDKEQWKNYIEEYKKNDSSASFLPDFDNEKNYEKWLSKIVTEECGINLPKDYSKASYFFLKLDDKIIGHISIRHSLINDRLKNYSGNIGCGIIPSERNKGYGTKLLNLGIQKCIGLDLEEVTIISRKDNKGFSKIIENNFGKLDSEVYVNDETIYQKYIIKLK